MAKFALTNGYEYNYQKQNPVDPNSPLVEYTPAVVERRSNFEGIKKQLLACQNDEWFHRLLSPHTRAKIEALLSDKETILKKHAEKVKEAQMAKATPKTVKVTVDDSQDGIGFDLFG
jgi:hypothetical protein